MLRTTSSGSALQCMILTGKEPLAELDSAEVEAKFLSATFPDTSNLSFDEVMQSCWRTRASIEQVCTSMEKSIRISLESDKP
jgi:hypothetical protein